jgi:antitoxin component YwqK of YwqJK toxin-antitoxin module
MEQDGNFKDYYYNGQIKEDGYYADGKKNGTWTYWYENGNMEWKEIYDYGKLKRSTGWHANGIKSEEGNFQDNLPFGKWVWWHDNAQKYVQGNFKINKVRDGVWPSWYQNGNKKEKIQYKDNILHGLCTLWYDNEDNTKKLEGESKKGKKDGTWTIWYQNGKISEKGSFKNGIKVGSWIYYNEDGSTNYLEDYLDDGTIISGSGH